MKKINFFLRRIKNFYHLLQAIIANIIYGFPAKNIRVIGVTGTDGKTTTTTLIAHILKKLGKKVSFISTIEAQIGDKKYETGLHVTTPSSLMIQKFLRQAVVEKNEFFVLEVTSHGLDQNRVWGINFEIGVITNITHEHLDYHQSYKEYVKTKEKLISMAKIGVIKRKDDSYRFLSLASKKKCQDYSKNLPIIEKHFPYLTQFNKDNFAAAYTVGIILGLKDEKIIQAAKTFKLPRGRFQIVYDKEFRVIVDFAHTPNAFKVLLPEVRKKYLSVGRLIHVFGCAGLRDYVKRPLMGQISSQYSDYLILTEEDYRTEDFKKICQQIIEGIKNKPYEVIKDRQAAINKAIRMAKKGDTVLITGKAHEKSLCRGKKEYPWDEFKAINHALKILLKSKGNDSL